MSISIINNYELNASIFLDSRRSIASLNDLKRISQAQDILYPHGFEVFCVQEGSYYVNVSPQGEVPEWKLRLINDEEPSFVSTYSSQKISELLQKASEDDTNIGINDNEPSPVRVYSSQKVEGIFAELRQETTRVDDDLLDIDTRVDYLEGEMWKIYGFDGSYDSLTNKPTLENYATKEYVDEAVANNGGGSVGSDIDTNNLVITNSISMGRKADTTIGTKSVALGYYAEASGKYSHAEGSYTTASGHSSHAEGYETQAKSDYQHVQGKYNIEDTAGTYAHIVGNGTDDDAKSNAHTLDWDGNAWFAGNVTIGADNKELATKEYVDNNMFTGDYNDLENKPVSIINFNTDFVDAVATYDEAYKVDAIAFNQPITVDDSYEYFAEAKYTDGTVVTKPLELAETSYRMYSRINAKAVVGSFDGNVIDTNNQIGYVTSLIPIKYYNNKIRICKRYNASWYDFDLLVVDENLTITNIYTHDNLPTVDSLPSTATYFAIYKYQTSSITDVDYLFSGDATDGGLYIRIASDTEYAGVCIFLERSEEGNSILSNTEYTICEATSNYVLRNSYFGLYIADSMDVIYPASYSETFVANDTGFASAMLIMNYGGISSIRVYTKNILVNTDNKELATKEYVDDAVGNISAGSDIDTNDLVVTNSISMDRKEGTTIGEKSFAVGNKVEASGKNSHAEGGDTVASGESSHAEGWSTNATGYFSHAEGEEVEASGYASHAQGSGTYATGDYSHAEGRYSVAEGSYSHAEGYNTRAKGLDSHAEGADTTASGSNSHAEGNSTTASGYASHAEGHYTIASSEYQHVQGKYNIEDITNTYAHIVGNGTSENTRSNAHTLDWDGNAWFAGEVYGTNIPYYREEVIVNMDYDDYDSIFKKTQPQNTQGYMSATSPSRSIGLVTGDEYIVEWDDKRFLVIATYNSNYNATQIEFTMDYGDNGKIIVEIVDYLNFTRLYYETQNYVGKITNNLFVKRPITNRLDSELLPDNIATKEYVDGQMLATIISKTDTLITPEVSTFAVNNGILYIFENIDGLLDYDRIFTPKITVNFTNSNNEAVEMNFNFGLKDDTSVLGHTVQVFSDDDEYYITLYFDNFTNINDFNNQVAFSLKDWNDDSYTINNIEWKDYIELKDTFATKKYVDDAVSNIDTGSNIDTDNLVITNSISMGRKESTTIGTKSVALGYYAEASGKYSHAEGSYTTASKSYSHAEGYGTTASGIASHAEGYETQAKSDYQHVQGKYNIEDTAGTYAHIVGNGTDDDAKSNAHTLDWDGNAWFAGQVMATNLPWSTLEIGELIIEQTVLFDTQSNGIGIGFTDDIPLTFAEGEKICFTFDNEQYICETRRLDEDNIYIGNGTLDSYDEIHNNEPFGVNFSKYGDEYIVRIYTIEKYAGLEVPVKIEKVTGELHKLDEKYLPDIVYDKFATKEYVDDNKFSKDYNDLENKPCYIITEEEVILNTTTFTFVDNEIDEYFYSQETLDSLILELDSTYRVTYNGTDYECVTQLYVYDDDVYYLGNLSILWVRGANTGEPFLFEVHASDNYQTNVMTKVAQDMVVEITKINKDIKKLDEELLPDTVATKEYVDSCVNEALGGTDSGDTGADIDLTNLVVTNSISMGRREGTTIGTKSFAVGNNVEASGLYSHAEGYGTTASGDYSHAEVGYTTASGFASHAEGYETKASGDYSHTEGDTTTASGEASHAEGIKTTANNYCSHAEGCETIASSEFQHVQGRFNIEDSANTYAHIVGNGDENTRSNAHTLDWDGNAWYKGNVTVDGTPTADNDLVTKKYVDEAVGNISVGSDIDTDNLVITNSISMGRKAGTTIGEKSVAEGSNTTASGSSSHAEGNGSTAKGTASHAEGVTTNANGYASHAEGSNTNANGDYTHTEGYYVTANGNKSHAEGSNTRANGEVSHAEGYQTIASGQYQHVQGKFNIEDTTNTYAHIVGNGTSSIRSNAHTLDWDGNAWYKGNVTVDGTPTADNDLVTKKYVDEAVANLSELKMNIVNGLTFANAYINYNNGDYVSGGSAYACQEYIPVISGATYEVSGVSNIVRIAYYDSSKTYINQYIDNTPTFNFTPPSNASYIRVHVDSNSNEWQNLSIESEIENYIIAYINNSTSDGSEGVDLSSYALKTDLHSHSNKTVIDTITSDMTTKWNQSIPFNDTYVSDCNAWLTNGYIKTSANQTSNLPSMCTGFDRWGILFFIAENVAQGTGTQMYFPIDGTYKGRIFIRSLTNMNQSPNVGEWNLLSTFSGNYNDLTNKPTIPSIEGLATEEYVDNNKFSGDYNDLTNKPTIPSTEGLATEEYVNNMLGGLRLIQMTQSEYDALEVKDSNTLYIII